MNHVILVGRLTRDPELRYVQGSGTAIANFGLAVDREFSGKDGKKGTDFLDIQVWGKSAENCANYIGKGSMVAIQGSIRIESYQNQAGETRKATKINANRVQFLGGKNEIKGQSFDPSFEPQGLDPNGWESIDDDSIPF